MAKPLYTKVIQGCVEQLYDDDGNCVSQEFVPFDGAPVDRRIYRPDDDPDEVPEGELAHDELIEHPDDIAWIESREKFCDTGMTQPPKPKK